MTTARQATTGYADVNGVRLYYEMAGSGHPLVLLHASIADCRMWDDQFDLFARDYRVVRYDHRGFGRSTMTPGPFALRDDLLGLMRYLDIERAHLIGLSMGGGVAIDFTLEHPDMVSALVPVAAGLGGFTWSDDEAPIEQAVEEAMKAGDLERANELEVRLWVDGPRRTPDQVDAGVRERVREMNANLLRRAGEMEQGKPQRLDPPAYQRLSEIHAPTLAIVGDEDVPDMLRVTDALATGIAGARKAVMHGTAHVPNMERPEEFNHLVLDFLAGQ